MNLVMNTSFLEDTTPPEVCLRYISEAGFTHIQWIHDWNNDYIYSESEMEQAGEWLAKYKLTMDGLHASKGVKKDYMSRNEYERKAGVDLLRNRVDFAARLSAGVMVLHMPVPNALIGSPNLSGMYGQAYKSLDALEDYCRKRKVKIAVENLPDVPFQVQADQFARLFDRYDSGYLGLCYDSGHGNCLSASAEDRLEFVDKFKERVINTHITDNDGSGDQHRLPFTGTVQWDGLAGILAQCPNMTGITLEAVIRRSGLTDIKLFLEEARRRGEELVNRIENCRQ